MDAAEVRDFLLRRLSRVLARNAGANALIRRAAALPHDWEEIERLIEDDALLRGLDADTREEVAATRAALRRVDDGSYGVCCTCGIRIGEARLRAAPFVLTCVSCTGG